MISSISPDVAILLATYNGESYIREQVASIASQKLCTPHLFVSDDGSTDNTVAVLLQACHEFSLSCEVVTVNRLPLLTSRSSANNFYNLILNAALPDGIKWVAFCDQDDIWYPCHLSRAMEKLSANAAIGGYSSSVVAFWGDGRTRFIQKNGYISRFNHLFESPGPGCSIVLSKSVFHVVRRILFEHLSVASAIDFHDWLVYAAVRSRGYEWIIDSKPSLFYRQHSNNVIGVGGSLRSWRRRFGMVSDSWYRSQCLQIAILCNQESALPIRLLSRFSILDRVRLFLFWPFLRRRSRDRLILSFAFLFMR